MPPYKLMALLRPEASPETLANIFRGIARVVYREQGVVRSVENLGVRPLAYRHHAGPEDYVTDARMVEARFALSPSALRVVEQRLSLEPEMLRFTHYREQGFKPGKVRPGGPKSRTKRFHGVVVRDLCRTMRHFFRSDDLLCCFVAMLQRLDSPMFDVDRFKPVVMPAAASATTMEGSDTVGGAGSASPGGGAGERAAAEDA